MHFWFLFFLWPLRIFWHCFDSLLNEQTASSLAYHITFFSFSSMNLATFTQLLILFSLIFNCLRVSMLCSFPSSLGRPRFFPPGNYVYIHGFEYVLHYTITIVMTYNFISLAQMSLQTHVRCSPTLSPCFMSKYNLSKLNSLSNPPQAKSSTFIYSDLALSLISHLQLFTRFYWSYLLNSSWLCLMTLHCHCPRWSYHDLFPLNTWPRNWCSHIFL